MEKLHPRKRLLQKYSDDNSERLLAPVHDSRRNAIIVEVTQPEQLSDISTTCSISPSPVWQHRVLTRDNKHQQAYNESQNDFKKDRNYFIPHLPNLEVTKVSEDNGYPWGLPLCPSNARECQHVPHSKQPVLPWKPSSPTVFTPQDLFLPSQICEIEDSCNYGSNKDLGAACEPKQKLAKNKVQSKNQVEIDTDDTKSIIEEKPRRKPRKATQPVIPKDVEPLLNSAGIDEKIASRVLVESDKELFRQKLVEVVSRVGSANPDIEKVLKTIRRKGKNKNSAATSRDKRLGRNEQLKQEKQRKQKELNLRLWYVGEIKRLKEIKAKLEQKFNLRKLEEEKKELLQRKPVEHKGIKRVTEHSIRTILFD